MSLNSNLNNSSPEPQSSTGSFCGRNRKEMKSLVAVTRRSYPVGISIPLSSRKSFGSLRREAGSFRALQTRCANRVSSSWRSWFCNRAVLQAAYARGAAARYLETTKRPLCHANSPYWKTFSFRTAWAAGEERNALAYAIGLASSNPSENPTQAQSATNLDIILPPAHNERRRSQAGTMRKEKPQRAK
jgi:hypothetical protein